MSLTNAMEAARSNLSVIQAKTSVVSRNVANASTDFASRKIASSVTGAAGYGVRLGNITRASNDALFHNLLAADSDASKQKAIVDSLDQINTILGDTEQDGSPAALIGKLSNALQQYSAVPSDFVRAQAVVSAANDVVTALNSATTVVQNVREDADTEIANSVASINSLLSEYDTVNKEIVIGTRFGNDITDYLDQRDRLLSSLSKEMGIRTISREGNDVAIYTDSGVTVYDGYPRDVTFERTQYYSAATTGNVVVVDGVPVTGSSATLPLQSGRLTGLVQIRDESAPTYQTQLDEMARGLTDIFSEMDTNGSTTAGLFLVQETDPADPTSINTTVPTGLTPGLAGTIAVNALFDASSGGEPDRLRDGWNVDYNTNDAAGYNERLLSVLDAFGTPRNFDSSAQTGTNVTLVSFASASESWLGNERTTASGALDFNATLRDRASESLSAETGVNLDYEMTILLDLEHSFQATTRLVDVIDKMYQYLLNTAA